MIVQYEQAIGGKEKLPFKRTKVGKGRPFSVTSWKMKEREEKSLDYKLETELNYKRF